MIRLQGVLLSEIPILQLAFEEGKEEGGEGRGNVESFFAPGPGVL